NHLMAPGHAHEAGPVERASCRGADRLSPSMGRRPHCTGGRQAEFWRHCRRSPRPSGASIMRPECVWDGRRSTTSAPAIGRWGTLPCLGLDDSLSGGPMETAGVGMIVYDPPACPNAIVSVWRCPRELIRLSC